MAIGLAFLKIPVTDLSRAVDFYCQGFGFTADFVSDEYGWAQLGGADIGLALYVSGKGGGDGMPGQDRDFHLLAPDLDALLAHVAPHAPAAAIATNDDGSRSLDVKDPDGNGLRIMEGV
ncbi:VOC family protein [Pyruvatibacter sp.]|uniref:VOC family protein n=1 Tax=Pyruvatibacter sp. TaxID=1981328 RepID=UPI003265BB8F